MDEPSLTAPQHEHDAWHEQQLELNQKTRRSSAKRRATKGQTLYPKKPVAIYTSAYSANNK